ncbi:hypothetical protein TrST_g2062 [Triparma strigata]|uniref:RNA polymerase sigma-70 region 2 domain-containing protein n=1 Tax=Triparma strigata TaxID=1606541 RepID=A0A9W7AGN0_9STRA|nr:hypothetical protein TrST_g2062 [Triparma strigata]
MGPLHLTLTSLFLPLLLYPANTFLIGPPPHVSAFNLKHPAPGCSRSGCVSGLYAVPPRSSDVIVARSSVLDIEHASEDLTNAPPAVVQNTLLNPTGTDRNPILYPGASTMPGFVTAGHIKQKNGEKPQGEVEALKAATASLTRASLNKSRSNDNKPPSTKKNSQSTKAMQTYIYKKSSIVPKSLLDFVAEIHMESRITPSEEVSLGEKTQQAMHLKSIRDDLAKTLGREPTNEEWAASAGKLNLVALENIMSEGLNAKNKLVTANLRLVQRVVNVYIRNGLTSRYDAGDMMQEGTIALIRAAEKFNPDKGFRFSTYAMFWIRASVKRSQLQQSREIAVPLRLQEIHKKYVAVRRTLQSSGKGCSVEDCSREMGVELNVLQKSIKAMEQQVLSLDSEIPQQNNNSDRNRATLHRFVESKRDQSLDFYSAERQLLRSDLRRKLLSNLSTEAANLVILRFGLSEEIDDDGMSIREISMFTGLKQDKIRRIIKQGLKKMRGSVGEWESFIG